MTYAIKITSEKIKISRRSIICDKEFQFMVIWSRKDLTKFKALNCKIK